MARPECIIMVGLPCSGKTMLANEKFPDHLRISSDDILEALCKRDKITYSEGFNFHIKEAGKLMKAKMRLAILEGKDIVIDQTNLTYRKRGSILNTIRQYGKLHDYVIRVQEVSATFEVLQERNNARAIATGKHIPQAVYESMIGSYDPIKLAEGFDILDITG